MRLAQIDAERFGPLDHPRDIGVPTQQVVDELDPQRLLLTDHRAALRLVAVDEDTDGVVERPQHRLRGPAHLLRIRRADDDG